MKNILVISVFLFLLVVFPAIPGYLTLYNEMSNPKTKLCGENGATKRISILKGDLDYLEVIFSKALENNSNNKDLPGPQETKNTINLFVYTSSLKIEVVSRQLLVEKLFYSKNKSANI